MNIISKALSVWLVVGIVATGVEACKGEPEPTAREAAHASAREAWNECMDQGIAAGARSFTLLDDACIAQHPTPGQVEAAQYHQWVQSQLSN